MSIYKEYKKKLFSRVLPFSMTEDEWDRYKQFRKENSHIKLTRIWGLFVYSVITKDKEHIEKLLSNLK